MIQNPHRPSVSFLVLALNEEIHIESTAKAVLEATQLTPLADFEVIFVDDGSTDSTGAIMDKIANENSKCRVIHNEKNLGLGGAYLRGLSLATCEYVMLIAGDDIMPSRDISKIIEHVGQADLVLPYLTNPKLRYLGRRIGSRCYTILINMLFGLNVRYYQGMLPRRALLTKDIVTTNSYAFFAEAAVKLLKARSSYVEVGIANTPSRKSGSVALQPKRLLGVLQAIFQLTFEIYFPSRK
jgi:glycosyltransferase involved in cell wall biosynthesis